MGVFFHQFYENSLDKVFYRSAPIARSTEGIKNYSGDFRPSLFSNKIFHGDQKKIMFVESSFTMAVGVMKFDWNGQRYKSGTVGIGGNHIINGFRTAFAIMDTPNLDTLVFGLLPLNMYSLTYPITAANGTLAWPEQCTQSLKRFGIQILRTSSPPFAQCGNADTSQKDMFRFILNPSNNQFYQIYNFLNLAYQKKTLGENLNRKDKSISLDMFLKAREEFYTDLKISNRNRFS